MNDEIEQQLKDINASLGEAGGVAWTELYGFATDEEGVKHQVKINVTARDLTSTLALEQLMSTLTTAKEVYHLKPYAQGMPAKKSETLPKEDPFPVAKAVAPVVTVAAPAGVVTHPAGAETFHCNKFMAGPYKNSIKLDFYTDSVPGKTKYPYVTSYVPVEQAMAWFQPFGDWTADHFLANQEYAVSLNITWKNSDKVNSSGKPYKDIKLIEAA